MTNRPLIALLLAAAAALAAGPAFADCWHNGQLVPEGTRVGGLVCVNGQWVEGRAGVSGTARD